MGILSRAKKRLEQARQARDRALKEAERLRKRAKELQKDAKDAVEVARAAGAIARRAARDVRDVARTRIRRRTRQRRRSPSPSPSRREPAAPKREKKKEPEPKKKAKKKRGRRFPRPPAGIEKKRVGADVGKHWQVARRVEKPGRRFYCIVWGQDSNGDWSVLGRSSYSLSPEDAEADGVELLDRYLSQYKDVVRTFNQVVAVDPRD